MKNALLLCTLLSTGLIAPAALAQTAQLMAIPSLDVPSYMGTWYQMAWFPNRFQKQCVSDTTATYRQREDGKVEVKNSCKLADGKSETALGLARTANSTLKGPLLQPAQLEVSFLPAALRWLPIWGDYWVLKLADDGRYAVIGEPSRKYLWVLTRKPQLSDSDETEIRAMLTNSGYDLGRWQRHPHTAGASATP